MRSAEQPVLCSPSRSNLPLLAVNPQPYRQSWNSVRNATRTPCGGHHARPLHGSISASRHHCPRAHLAGRAHLHRHPGKILTIGVEGRNEGRGRSSNERRIGVRSLGVRKGALRVRASEVRRFEGSEVRRRKRSRIEFDLANVSTFIRTSKTDSMYEFRSSGRPNS